MSGSRDSIPRQPWFLNHCGLRSQTITVNATAAPMLSGFLFANEALPAQNDGGKPAQCEAASENRSSVTRPQDTQALPVFKITPSESKIKFDVEASVAIAGTFDNWDAVLRRQFRRFGHQDSSRQCRYW
jgi:hypothetical protein